jgi:hypothetical protein
LLPLHGGATRSKKASERRLCHCLVNFPTGKSRSPPYFCGNSSTHFRIHVGSYRSRTRSKVSIGSHGSHRDYRQSADLKSRRQDRTSVRRRLRADPHEAEKSALVEFTSQGLDLVEDGGIDWRPQSGRRVRNLPGILSSSNSQSKSTAIDYSFPLRSQDLFCPAQFRVSAITHLISNAPRTSRGDHASTLSRAPVQSQLRSAASRL